MKKLLLSVFLLTSSSVLADDAVTIRDSKLRAQAEFDARVVADVPGGSALTTVRRKGAWYEVELSDGQQGWLRLYDLRLTGTTATTTDAGSDLGDLFSQAGRSGSTGATSTTGIRGLSEEEIRNAQPDYAKLDRLNDFAANAGLAQSFAERNRLTARDVVELNKAEGDEQ